jgi:hypothetical protein
LVSKHTSSSIVVFAIGASFQTQAVTLHQQKFSSCSYAL